MPIERNVQVCDATADEWYLKSRLQKHFKTLLNSRLADNCGPMTGAIKNVSNPFYNPNSFLEVIGRSAALPVFHNDADGFFEFGHFIFFYKKALYRHAIGIDNGLLIDGGGKEKVRDAF